jgi:hypothetical protein
MKHIWSREMLDNGDEKYVCKRCGRAAPLHMKPKTKGCKSRW